MQITVSDTNITIPVRKLATVLSDPEKSARAVRLVYVSDQSRGITRVKAGRSFVYKTEGKVVKDPETLSRIKKLVIPPAWQVVWICESPNGHLQCTGIDAKGRKQYRYHPLWNALRKEVKFYRLLQFGEALPVMRGKISTHLSGQELSRKKVLAAIVSIMDKTGIRVGSSMYEKLYGSFGISTLKNRHTQVKGGNIVFSFKGKKGVYQHISLRSKRLAKIVRQCKEIPGKELFQYFDTGGQRHGVSSEDVNEYIKEISGDEFTSKDFRTWAGTVECISNLAAVGHFKTQAQMKRNIVAALDCVAQTLGNTRNVCKNHYVHPLVLTLYEEDRLDRYIRGLNTSHKMITPRIERALLKMLKKEAVSGG